MLENKMTKKITIEQLKNNYQNKVSFIYEPLGVFDEKLISLQRELFNFLFIDFVENLEIEQNIVMLNVSNSSIIENFEKQVCLFREVFTDSFYKGIGVKMLKKTEISSEYYRENLSANTLKYIQNNINLITGIIGFNTNGDIIEGSYFSKITKNETLRTELLSYIVKYMNSEQNYSLFRKGFYDIMKNYKGIKDDMVNDIENYIYDMVSSCIQATNNFYADFLKMTDYFYYQGDEIETSRQFCRERHGKYFTREEAEEWDKQNWPGKIPGVKFIAQRGGYGCRHTIMWVTKGYYEIGEKAIKLTKFKYDLDK